MRQDKGRAVRAVERDAEPHRAARWRRQDQVQVTRVEPIRDAPVGLVAGRLLAAKSEEHPGAVSKDHGGRQNDKHRDARADGASTPGRGSSCGHRVHRARAVWGLRAGPWSGRRYRGVNSRAG